MGSRQLSDRFLQINDYPIFDKELRSSNNDAYDFFNSIPYDALMEVTMPRSVIHISYGGVDIGKITAEPGYSNARKCLKDGWELWAVRKKSEVYDAPWTHHVVDIDGHRATTGTTESVRAIVTIVGISPDATEEERNLFEICLWAEVEGIKHPSLTAQSFRKFANQYEISEEPMEGVA